MMTKTALAVILTLALPAASWGASDSAGNNSKAGSQQQQNSTQQSKDQSGNANQSGADASKAQNSNAQNNKSRTSADQQNSQSSSSSSSGQFIAKPKPNQMNVSDNLMGAPVNNQKKQQIGSISDLIVNKDGKIEGVVISVGGFLGIGSKSVALPWDAVQFQSGQKNSGQPQVIVNKSQKELENAPSFNTKSQQKERQQSQKKQQQQQAQKKQQQKQMQQQGSSMQQQPSQSQQKQQKQQ